MRGPKIDLIVHELARYNILVGALQETRWFGNEVYVYRVADGVVLMAGRCTPTKGDVVQRGEGLALVLRGSAISAWNRGGKWWTSMELMVCFCIPGIIWHR